MRKFLFCLTFALCLLATAARVSASNIIASGECGVDGGNVTWTLDDAGTLTIRGSGRMNDYNMNLRSPWYQNRTQIQKVVIEEGVTNVGKRAFAECDVTSVTIPDSVTSIGPYSFSNCTDLEEIAFPSGVTFIDDGAFFNCKSLTRVVIPGNVKMIGDTNLPAWSTLATGAFKGCSALKSVVILDGVTKIGNFSFQLCAALESVSIPASVTHLGGNAFLKCDSLTEILYAGSEAQWEAITGGGKDSLPEGAVVRCHSAAPEEESDEPDEDFFVIGRDSNLFRNFSEDFLKKSQLPDAIGTAYPVSLPLYSKLVRNLDFAQEVRLLDYMNTPVEEWSGVCEGISISMALAKTGTLDVSLFDDGYSPYQEYYDVSPIESAKASMQIYYYQLLQMADKLKAKSKLINSSVVPFIGGIQAGIFTEPNWDGFWGGLYREVRQAVAEDAPVVFSFGYGHNKSHTVLICGIDDSRADYTLLKLYDCDVMSDYTYLAVYDEAKTVYMTSNPDNPPQNPVQIDGATAYFTDGRVRGDWRHFQYYSNEALNAIDAATDALLQDGGTYAEFDAEGASAFTLTNAEGEGFSFDGNAYAGNMPVADAEFIHAGRFTARYLIPASESYSLSRMRDGSAYKILVGGDYYAAKTTGADEIRFSAGEGVRVLGDDYSFSVSMSAKQTPALLRLSGTCRDDSEFLYQENGTLRLHTDGAYSQVKAENISASDAEETFLGSFQSASGLNSAEPYAIDATAQGEEIAVSLTNRTDCAANVRFIAAAYDENGKFLTCAMSGGTLDASGKMRLQIPAQGAYQIRAYALDGDASRPLRTAFAHVLAA